MSPEVSQAIEIVESGYEYLLAFASQGREPSDKSGPSQQVRSTLNAMHESMTVIMTTLMQGVSSNNFNELLSADLKKAQTVITFVIDQEKIGSELIDNLNASNHLRTALTDLFLYGEAKDS